MKVDVKTGVIAMALILVLGMIGWKVWFSEKATASKSNHSQVVDQSGSRSIRRSVAARESYRQRAGKGRSQSRDEESDHPQIDLEEVNALLDSGEVFSLEQRGQSENLIRLNEPLAVVLKLDKDEIEELNKLWLRIRLQLNILRVQHVKQQVMDDGEVWVGVEVFSDEGDLLRQAFIADTLGMVGEHRGGLLLKGLNAHAAYGRWGKAVGSGFSIRVIEQNDGSHLYNIKEPAKEGGVPGRTWRTNRMPDHLILLSDALKISPTP